MPPRDDELPEGTDHIINGAMETGGGDTSGRLVGVDGGQVVLEQEDGTEAKLDRASVTKARLDVEVPPDAVRKGLLSRELPRFTPATITDPEAFVAELDT